MERMISDVHMLMVKPDNRANICYKDYLMIL